METFRLYGCTGQSLWALAWVLQTSLNTDPVFDGTAAESSVYARAVLYYFSLYYLIAAKRFMFTAFKTTDSVIKSCNADLICILKFYTKGVLLVMKTGQKIDHLIDKILKCPLWALKTKTLKQHHCLDLVILVCLDVCMHYSVTAGQCQSVRGCQFVSSGNQS